MHEIRQPDAGWLVGVNGTFITQKGYIVQPDAE